MSQPVGIIAKITLPKASYKKYVRQIAAGPVAGEIFACLQDDHAGDYFIFRYLEKENALYVFFYFRYGGGDFLLGHPLLMMLQKAAGFLDDSSVGYLLATLDMLNLVQNDDLVYAATIHHRKFVQHRLTGETLKEVAQDVDRYFFKHREDNFSLAFERGRIVDSSVKTRVRELQESHALQNLKKNLHAATEESPIELFSGYFYNGRQFYTFKEWSPTSLKLRKRELAVFDDVDLQALRKTSYGLCDGKSVIIGIHRIVTPPEKFKLHQKGETVFYSSAEEVYDEHLKPYPGSDGMSFKLKNAYVGEDKDYIYFGGVQLLKLEIGDYKICDAGYFTSRVVLYSPMQVRTPGHVFTEINAPTFAIIDPNVGEKAGINPSGVYRGCMIVHCKDKHGELIIYSHDVYKNPVPEARRIGSLTEYLKEIKAAVQ